MRRAMVVRVYSPLIVEEVLGHARFTGVDRASTPQPQVLAPSHLCLDEVDWQACYRVIRPPGILASGKEGDH